MINQFEFLISKKSFSNIKKSNFSYQKLIFWYQKIDFLISENGSYFLISGIHFLISEIQIPDIKKNHFLISENTSKILKRRLILWVLLIADNKKFYRINMCMQMVRFYFPFCTCLASRADHFMLVQSTGKLCSLILKKKILKITN